MKDSQAREDIQILFKGLGDRWKWHTCPECGYWSMMVKFVVWKAEEGNKTRYRCLNCGTTLNQQLVKV